MNLVFYAETSADFNKVRRAVDASDWHAEFDKTFESASFPVETQHEADVLEIELQELFCKEDGRIDGHFEGADND